MEQSAAKFCAKPFGLLSKPWHYRYLIGELLKFQVSSRYRGSFVGWWWAFVQPLLMLTIFSFFYRAVGNSHWVNAEDAINPSLIIFPGLIICNFFIACVIQAPLIIINQPHYVKKIVFPLEVLAWVAVASNLFDLLISTIVCVCFYIFCYGAVHWAIVFLPVIYLPLAIFALTICWLLSSLGVFIRDVVQVASLMSTGVFFLSPVFYRVADLPATLKVIVMCNPLTFIIQQSRQVFLQGEMPNFTYLLVYSLVALLSAYAGLLCFRHLHPSFADVL